MPVYVFRCEKGHKFDRFLKLEDYDTPQVCDCGCRAERQIVATMIRPDIPNWDRYVSPATGKLITSYKERREDMKASGCVDYEPSLTNETKKSISQQEAYLDKAIEETVDMEFEKMDSRKKEQLESELKHMDIEVTREAV